MDPPAHLTTESEAWSRRVLDWCARHRWLLGLLAVLVALALSSIPNTHPPRVRGLDKFQHVVEYFALGLVFLNVATRGLSRMRPLPMLGAWLGLMGLTLLDESYQRWIPGRTFDWWDVAASATGGLAALGTALVVHAVLARPHRPS